MLLLKDAIMEYELECKVRRLAEGTINNYDRHLRYLRDYLEAEHNVVVLEEIKPLHLKRFLLMKEEQGRKAHYINDLLKVFRTFFNYLKAEGHIRTKPTAQVRNMKQPKLKILTFTPNEIRSLLNYFSGRDFLSVRNRTI